MVLLLLNIPILLTVLVNRGWTPTVRRFEQALAAVTCAALVWITRGGPVFMSPSSEQVFKSLVSLIVLLYAHRARRLVRPPRPACPGSRAQGLTPAGQPARSSGRQRQHRRA